MSSKEGSFALEKGFNALEGVFIIGEGKSEIRGRLNALEWIQLHRNRVLTKFQVNLVITKAIFMVIF